jgi:hypothetical protein
MKQMRAGPDLTAGPTAVLASSLQPVALELVAWLTVDAYHRVVLSLYR